MLEFRCRVKQSFFFLFRIRFRLYGKHVVFISSDNEQFVFTSTQDVEPRLNGSKCQVEINRSDNKVMFPSLVAGVNADRFLVLINILGQQLASLSVAINDPYVSMALNVWLPRRSLELLFGQNRVVDWPTQTWSACGNTTEACKWH